MKKYLNWNYIRSLFRTHFEMMTEDHLIETCDIGNIIYEEEKFKSMIDYDTMMCQACNTEFTPEKSELEFLFGNRVVDWYSEGLCSCGHHNINHIRLRGGYIMRKKNDKWMCFVMRRPKLLQWLM
jgi:hypothetical protein